MRKFNLLLTFIAISFIFIAAAPKTDSRTLVTAYLPDPESCNYYFEITLSQGQSGCKPSCLPGCQIVHFIGEEIFRIKCACPPSTRYNPETLSCDWPWNVPCYHSNQCN